MTSLIGLQAVVLGFHGRSAGRGEFTELTRNVGISEQTFYRFLPDQTMPSHMTRTLHSCHPE